MGDNAKAGNWKTYVSGILLTKAVGVLAWVLTRDEMDFFQSTAAQPPLSLPSILFPIIWSILYVLMGIGAARISLSKPSSARSIGLNLFVIQLGANFLWPFAFFNLQAYGFVVLWLLLLWVLVAAMIYVFYKTDSLAAILQIPYLLWLTFAFYLNIGVWLFNS